jgi:hypothetical protein
MKFNAETRKKFREVINSKIEKLSNEIDIFDNPKKFVIDPEWLDVLLFDEAIDDRGVHYKTIGYTYDNLRYVDLTYANFEDVSFDHKNKVNEKEYINLSNTNARIDFSKTYEYKYYNQIVLSNISFKNLDLSYNNSSDENEKSVFEKCLVINCDLSNTGLCIKASTVHFYESKLNNINLSEMVMYPDEACKSFNDSDISNTGLRIKVDDKVNPDSVKRIMQDPHFVGCYVGNTKTYSQKDRHEYASKLAADYEAWSNSIIDEIADSLEEQVLNDSSAHVMKKVFHENNDYSDGLNAYIREDIDD